MEDKFCQLSVGHLKFFVSKDTLLKDPRSYFAELLSDNLTNRQNDVIYIDRDGTHFNAILNHLRGCLELDKWRIRHLRELAIEADYYSLTQLKDKINSEIDKRHLRRRTSSRNTLNCSLINPDYVELMRKLKEENRKTFVIFLLSDREAEFESFFMKMKEECMSFCTMIEFTYIYDIYPYQKIQVYDHLSSVLLNVCTLTRSDLKKVRQVSDQIIDFYEIDD